MAAPEHPKRVLAADVGGTHTRLSLYESAQAAQPAASARLRSADHASLDALLAAFLDAHGGPGLASACVAVAGPVIDDAVAVTNLPWRVEASALAKVLGARQLKLMNDLEATAFGMLALPAERFEVLQRGTRPRAKGPVVVAAAGTGLGLAVLDWDGARHHPRATEAGHVGYAPRTAREMRVLERMRERLGRVSVEQVVSGPGLAAVYDVLREGDADAPPLDGEDRSAAIARAALGGSDASAAEALDLFCESYAAAVGDAALAQLALGGVWIGGAIAGKILPALRRDGVLEAFRDKGRFRPLLESLPLEVCLEADTALLGASQLALRNAEGA
ncbi:MAG: glucokinase [Myxococcota bacterium]